MIRTIYKSGGKMIRETLGYGGGLCRQADGPYVKNQAGTVVADRPTAEACLPEAVRAALHEQERAVAQG